MMEQPQLMLEYRKLPELPVKPKYKHKKKWHSNSKVAKLEAEIEELEKRAMMYQHLVNAWIKTRRLLVEDKFDDWRGSKSTLLSTYQDGYNKEGSWSYATQDKLEQFARKICEGTQLGDCRLRDARDTIEQFNSPYMMIAIIQCLYKQEIVRYMEELHRFQAQASELELEYKKRFERWKTEELATERQRMIESLRKDQKIANSWIGDFKVRNEHGVVLIFGRFYETLGFSSLKSFNRGFPDCVAIRDGKECRIELEYMSSNFIQHKHDTSKVDMVVCWKKDKELSIPIIELESFLEANGYKVKEPEYHQSSMPNWEEPQVAQG
jgi:transcriptional antiterminator Rof (Rho-off)